MSSVDRSKESEGLIELAFLVALLSGMANLAEAGALIMGIGLKPPVIGAVIDCAAVFFCAYGITQRWFGALAYLWIRHLFALYLAFAASSFVHVMLSILFLAGYTAGAIGFFRLKRKNEAVVAAES